jgi:ribosomal protein S18 acetylase RimI-like enzyme
LRQFRAQGRGVKIAQELLKSATQRGHKKVRLELYKPPKQQRAIAFYRELGFYEILGYRNSDAKLCLEKQL